MYLIVQARWFRGGSQNGEHVVATSGRKKEANGLVRHHFKSSLEVIQKHLMYDVEDFEIDEDNYSLTLGDAEGVWFHSRFYVQEVEDEERA